MYKPGDLVTEVVVWEVVEFDEARKVYKCRERKGKRMRYFQLEEISPAGPQIKPVEQI